MRETIDAPPAGLAAVARKIQALASGLSRAASLVAPVVLRAALAVPFFKSGLTRWDGFAALSPATAYLFENEFQLHVFGQAYDFPYPLVTAHLVGMAEIMLPILLVAGLATRFAALGLLVMTAVIQLVMPEGWANFHLPWAGLALAILALGAGKLSLDHLIYRHFAGQIRPPSARPGS